MTQTLVVIDVQAVLFDPAGPFGAPFEAHLVIDRINATVAKARAAHAQVIWVQHESAPDGLLSRGSPAWQLQANLAAIESDIRVFKTTPDSFLRTHLHERLTTLGTTELVVCGYASEFCVDTTVRRAAALGYGVTLVADAHTTHDKPHASGAQIRAHENATLTSLNSFGVPIVVTSAADMAFRA